MAQSPSLGRILLTGPRGSIGSLLFSALHRWKVEHLVIIDTKKPKNLPKGVNFYRVDLTEPGVDARIARILEKEKIDTVVHMAILWSPNSPREYAHEVNVIGTMHVLNACHQQNIRKFILASSTIVYGAKATNPNYLTESSPLYGGYSNVYVRDLVEVENEVRKFRALHPKATVTVLRPGMVVGPTIYNFVTRILSKPVIPTILGYDPLVQFLHEDDLLRAIRRALQKDFHGEYNLVGEGVLPLSYSIKLAGRINLPLIYSLAKPALMLLWHADMIEFPSNLIDNLRYVWVADGAKAQEEMGFKPRYTSRRALESFFGQERLRRIHLAHRRKAA